MLRCTVPSRVEPTPLFQAAILYSVLGRRGRTKATSQYKEVQNPPSHVKETNKKGGVSLRARAPRQDGEYHPQKRLFQPARLLRLTKFIAIAAPHRARGRNHASSKRRLAWHVPFMVNLRHFKEIRSICFPAGPDRNRRKPFSPKAFRLVLCACFVCCLRQWQAKHKEYSP